MKVILLKDVPQVGQKYDVKEVSRGFANNFLFPQKNAEIATKKAMSRLEERKQVVDTEKKVQTDLMIKNVEDLNGVKIVMQEKANEQGHLFAGVHKEEIVPEIKKQAKLDIEAGMIDLEEPIKELGEHEISVSVGNKKSTFTLVVEEVK